MKKVILLSLLIPFSCGKNDDSDDSSNSKFRDIHSSVYWYTSQYDGYWITFSPDYLLKEIYPPDPNDDNCTIYFQGDFTDQEYDGHFYSGSNNVLIENENYYSFSMASTEDTGSFYEAIHQFEVVENKLYWTPPSDWRNNETIELVISQGPPPSQGNDCFIAYVL